MELRTIETHIASIRRIIAQTVDDTRYEDEFLFKLFLDCRAIILKQKLDNLQYFSQFNYRPFYMPLEKETVYESTEIPADLMCRERKSKYKIPRTIPSKLRDTLRVMTIEGIDIDRGDARSAKLDEYSFTRAGKPKYEIVGEYLVIYRKLDLPGVILDGVWEDITDIPVIPTLDTATETYLVDYSYDPYTDTVPLDFHLNEVVYELVIKKMGIAAQFPQDPANNSQNLPSNNITK